MVKLKYYLSEHDKTGSYHSRTSKQPKKCNMLLPVCLAAVSYLRSSVTFFDSICLVVRTDVHCSTSH